MTGAWPQDLASTLLPRPEYKGGMQAWVDKSPGVSIRVVLERFAAVVQTRHTFPPSTKTDARISSGSPILPRAGTLRSSKFHL